jgi:hypothetical protein
MKILRFLPVLGSLAILTACIGGASAGKSELKSMSDQDLCENYYFSKNPSLMHDDKAWPTKRADIKQEIDRRHLVDANDWQLIDSGRIQVGESECGLRAAWGYPLRLDHMTTAAGDTMRFVYSPAQDAVVVGGKVTNFRVQ